MLEIIAGVVVFLSIAIVATLVISGFYIFIGTINGTDTDAFYNDEE
jgi:hypothetical protein